MLTPFGGGKMVLLDGLHVGEQGEDIEEVQEPSRCPEACNNSEDNTSIILDWEWTGAFEQLPGTSAAREFDGRCIEPVNADVQLSQGALTYHLCIRFPLWTEKKSQMYSRTNTII